MASYGERRAYRRSPVEVPLELSDLRDCVTGTTIDVSRGGLLAHAGDTGPVGTLLRVRVIAEGNEAVVAIGVVVRSVKGDDSQRLVAIALTSTSDEWDCFWNQLVPHINQGGQA